MGLYVDGTQRRAVFKIGHALAIGTVNGLKTRLIALNKLLFRNFGSVGKEVVFLILNRTLIDLPQAIALTGVDQTATIGRKIYATLLFGRVGNLTGGGIFHGSNVNIAVQNEGDFFPVGRQGYLGGAAIKRLSLQILIVAIGRYGHFHTLGLLSFTHGIKLAVVPEAQGSVV